MFSYYVKLAFVSFKRTPLLSFLMVLLIAMGIGATMTTFTVSYMMNQDPIPSKSDRIFSVQMDSRGDGYDYGEEVISPEVTYLDVQNIMHSDIPKYYVALSALRTMLKNPTQQEKAVSSTVRTTTADFFAMFNTPFLFGTGWDKSADENAEQVIVLTKKANNRFFNGENSVGQTLQFGEALYRVVGVLDDWYPIPKFYGVKTTAFSDPFDVFIPFNTQIQNELYTSKLVNTTCWKNPEDDSYEAFLASECRWVLFWVELESASSQAQYKAFLDNYAREQQAQGRFANRIYNRVVPVKQHLIDQEIVSDDSKLAVWLSALFLIVCLLNCMGLMMAKFHSKAGEVGLRRAVGASKQHIVAQFSVELAVIGFIGGVAGLSLAQVGLAATANLYSYLHSSLMQMNAILVGVTILLAVIVSCIFGLVPILKASRTQPSSQLKSL